MMLQVSGESATLLHKATRLQVSGIYSVMPGGVSPLDGRTIRPGVYFTCAAADVAGVEPGWECDIRGQILPIIAAVADGAGFVELYLGDQND
jgi:hypothetical protein